MLDIISKHWAIVSVAALFVASLFNVGYFLVVGIHFMGVMDITNIVYVFALAWAAIFMIAPAYINTMFDKRKRKSMFDLRNATRKDKAHFAIGVFVLVATAIVFTWYFEEGPFIRFVLSGIVLEQIGLLSYQRWREDGAVHLSSAIVTAALAMATSIFFGSWVANTQMQARNVYTIVTKDSTIEQVRILRASSTGIVHFTNEAVGFVPMGELKSVMAAKYVEPKKAPAKPQPKP